MKRTPITRKTRVKRANRPRKAENFVRAYGGRDRVRWINHQPCCSCGLTPSEEKPTQNVHVRSGGKSRKADACWIAPLCHWCHAKLHRIGKASFEAEYQIDLDHEAAVTDARWEQYEAAHQKSPVGTPPEGEGVKQ